MTEDYRAPRPMDPAHITLETLVWVPVWKAGTVIGFDYGHVIQIRDHTDNESYIVCLKSTQAYNGTKQIYFAYSIACGICHDTYTRRCFQCFADIDTATVEHAHCRINEFPPK